MKNVGLIIVVFVFFGCITKTSNEISLSDIKNFADAEVMIEKLRKQETPNWEKIGSEIERTTKIVKEIDQKHLLNYQQEMAEALGFCSTGKKVKTNQQTIAKGLQHIAVLAILDELNEMLIDNTALDEGIDRVENYVDGILPTFVRRDKDFFENKNLQNSLNEALKQLRERKIELALVKKDIENIIYRTYALCVLFEVIEIEKLRDTDLTSCNVKRKEAEIFYRIINPVIEKKNVSDHEVIANMLNTSYENMDSKLLEEILNRNLSGIQLR